MREANDLRAIIRESAIVMGAALIAAEIASWLGSTAGHAIGIGIGVFIILGGLYIGRQRPTLGRLVGRRVLVPWELQERPGKVVRLLGEGFRPQAEVLIDGEEKPISMPIEALTFPSLAERLVHFLPERFYGGLE